MGSRSSPLQGYATSILRLRCQRYKLVLRKHRPRAFAFLAHDGCPVFGGGIEDVNIHELPFWLIEREIDGMGSFIERAGTNDLGRVSTKDIEPMQNVTRSFVIEADEGHG